MKAFFKQIFFTLLRREPRREEKKNKRNEQSPVASSVIPTFGHVMVGSTHFFVASGPQRMVVATSSMCLWRMQSNEIRW